MPSPPHFQESPKVNGFPREQAGGTAPSLSDRSERNEIAEMIDLVHAYQINVEGDRDLLLALLKAKQGEEERNAAHSSLHNSILRVRGTISPPNSRRAVSPPRMQDPTSSLGSQSQAAMVSPATVTTQRPDRSPQHGKSPEVDNLERQWLPSLSTVLHSLAEPEVDLEDSEGVPASVNGPSISRGSGGSPHR
ncbi:hypothetical protein CALCODRAFT_495755 [Calocera cornea HHB12733]|uniref:Uncharacterized protein n=1 Tax=Calocera cornea HHB12733 TaxID=1353952 RepID=A0A165G889_9BASI|nr:hypothetical protein CALCODRAFT_495755 [Calocera cornea HHB12733]